DLIGSRIVFEQQIGADEEARDGLTLCRHRWDPPQRRSESDHAGLVAAESPVPNQFLPCAIVSVDVDEHCSRPDRRSEPCGSDVRAEQRALWKRDIEETFGNGPDAAGKALFRPGGGLLCRIRRDPFTFEDVWSSEVIVPSFQERRSALTKGAEDSIDRAE